MSLVISVWNYHERLEKNNGVISKWIKDSHLSKKAQARFERALDQLRQLPKTEWHKPNPASNIGNHTYVIRFKDITNAQLRVFGHFFDDHKAFVMTFNGGEKDNAYFPNNYQEISQRHRLECDKDFSNKTKQYRTHCKICTGIESRDK